MWKYKGGRSIIGVPARDLTDEEAEKYGKQRLRQSGLYRPVRQKVQQEQVKEEPAEE